MIKKKLYGKTQRFGNQEKVIITEKYDGSNLTLFKCDDVLYIGQRNYIFKADELEEHKDKVYGGLIDWVNENKEELMRIKNGGAIIGEYLEMGHIKYHDIEEKFVMFAKAQIHSPNAELYNKNYTDGFVYAFENEEVPSCIGGVRVVADGNAAPTIDFLDRLYDKYKEDVNRQVEGFIVLVAGEPYKYVRFKRGKETKHVISYANERKENE